jgi:hypothetical protein
MFSRIRSRTNEKSEYAQWIRTYTYDHTSIGPGCAESRYRSDIPRSTLYVSDLTSSTISDSPYGGFKRHFHPVRRKAKIPRPCKPTEHYKSRIIPNKDETYFEHGQSANSYPCLLTDTFIDQITPIAWAANVFGDDVLRARIADATHNIGTYSFRQPDWFAIVDQFNESVDSLVPSNFFLGEDIAEGGIFIDAVNLVIRPKKTITHLFRNVIEHGLVRKNLGQINEYYRRASRRVNLTNLKYSNDIGSVHAGLKDAVNANLLYKFGIAPAIKDIRSSLDAHNVVNSRLRYLADNAGRYVPIRVRRKLDSAFDSAYSSSIHEQLLIRQSAQHSICSMFAQGRVRTDINQANQYRAYAEYFGLNKIVGTAWELIPFTFVLDWFTNAQERINDLTRIRLGEGPFYNLVGLGHSIKNVLAHEIYVSYDISSTYGCPKLSPVGPLPILTVESTKYVRESGLPDTSGVVDVSALGLFHGFTGLELLFQKLT